MSKAEEIQRFLAGEKITIKNFSLGLNTEDSGVSLVIELNLENIQPNSIFPKYSISAKSDKSLIINTEFKSWKNYNEETKKGVLYYILPLKNIDAKTLHYIPATLEKYYCRGHLQHKYYADKNGYYYIDFTKKPYILKLKTDELTGLTVFDDIFAKTESFVFFMGKQVNGVNAKLFKPIYKDLEPWWLEYTDGTYLIQNQNCYRCTKKLINEKQ